MLFQGHGRPHPRPEQEARARRCCTSSRSAQAVIALREKIIAGKAPGLKSQEELFVDELGHGTAPLRVLVGYCNFAVMYRRSPIGLPAPAELKGAKLGDQEQKLNTTPARTGLGCGPPAPAQRREA